MNKFTDYEEGRKAHQECKCLTTSLIDPIDLQSVKKFGHLPTCPHIYDIPPSAASLIYPEKPDKWHYVGNDTYFNQTEWERELGQPIKVHAPECVCPEHSKPDNLLLHLRFAVLKDTIAGELIEVTDHIHSIKTNPIIDKVYIGHTHLFHGHIDDIRTNLDQWADSLETEKPLPRVQEAPLSHSEASKCDQFDIWLPTDRRESISRDIFEAMQKIIGHEIPIYTPQKYRAEWIEPKILNSKTFDEMFPLRHIKNDYQDGFNDGLFRLAEKLATLPQVYEFKLWREQNAK